MAYEIYYTSAPEGLKRGTSGFCTVAASENIPKALWDRLETLSAYRHHVAAGAGERVGGGGRNPVSWGHWILNVTGRTYHVLSRVCDAGVDHTQRSNSFAHHLVLEQKEIEAAPGGPAWMLMQAGVMARQWDGRVGNLPARNLPGGGGDGNLPGICREWGQLTGDAGWGGHLAESFARSPARPICLLFSTDDGMSGGDALLPLLGEAIALLPPAARWNVTFNTYFTSMPTSATCAWRCCLAGTPAAEVGKRYAASGLLLDLTDRSRIPAFTGGGALVQQARTGQAPAQTKPAVPNSKKGVELPKTDASRTTGPREMEIQDDGRETTEAGGVIEFADEPANPREAVAPEAHSPPHTPPADAPAWRKQSRKQETGYFKRAEWALEEAEREAERAAQRRRQQVSWLFAAALVAIGIGVGAIFLAHSHMTPPPMPLPSAQTQPENSQQVAGNNPPPAEQLPPQPTPAISPQTVPAPAPLAPTPAPAAIPIPRIIYPTDLLLRESLARPNVGNGLGEWTQPLKLNPADLESANTVSQIRMAFQQTQTDSPNPDAVTVGTSSGNPTISSKNLGVFEAKLQPRNGKKGISLMWHPNSQASSAAEVLFVQWVQPQLEVHWNLPMVLKNASLLGYYYWMLQNSTILLERPNVGRTDWQGVHFKPFDAGKLDFTDTKLSVDWPVDLPEGAVVTAPSFSKKSTDPPAAGNAEPAWQVSWYTDWQQKDAALRTAANASQVLKFKRPTSSGVVDAWFLLTFHAGLGKIDSNFANRRATDRADMEHYQGELAALEAQIVEAKRIGTGVTTQPVSPELQQKYDQTAALVKAYKEAMAGYNDMQQFDVGVEMPGGVHLATLHFARPQEQSGK